MAVGEPFSAPSEKSLYARSTSRCHRNCHTCQIRHSGHTCHAPEALGTAHAQTRRTQKGHAKCQIYTHSTHTRRHTKPHHGPSPHAHARMRRASAGEAHKLHIKRKRVASCYTHAHSRTRSARITITRARTMPRRDKHARAHARTGTPSPCSSMCARLALAASTCADRASASGDSSTRSYLHRRARHTRHSPT